jgi:NB-ARC domain
MGGVGKTRIAIQNVTQFENEYESIAWVTASSQKELWAGLESIARQTGSVDPTNLQPSEIANGVVNWLYEKDNWLLVLDNVDDIKVVDGYLPRLRPGGGHVLITTRNPNSINIPAQGLEIGVYEPGEAKQLLTLVLDTQLVQ